MPGPPGMAASSWLRRSAADAEPAGRLLCFPHAGGGASSFNGWRRDLPGWIELVKVQLPGREDRREDTAHTRVDELIAALVPHVQAMLDLPLVIYGHSVGSLVAFELTRELRRRGHAAPLALIISSRRAPHRPLRDEHLLHGLPDAVLAGRVQALGGIPSGMLEDSKWRGHFLPRIRADLCLSDTYTYREGPRLDCPLHTFIGEHDNLVARDDWEAWSEHASGEFSRRILPGGHFFSREGQIELLGSVSRIVTAALARPAERPAAAAARSAR
jgi:medium-chain acyl-[acyl-carrier-protein] hydrolase